MQEQFCSKLLTDLLAAPSTKLVSYNVVHRGYYKTVPSETKTATLNTKTKTFPDKRHND